MITIIQLARGSIFWSSKKQPTFMTSSVEAEYHGMLELLYFIFIFILFLFYSISFLFWTIRGM